MAISTKTIPDFVTVLAGREPVPGGGGASALVGAVGAALGNMVGSLTAGKKKYAGVEAEILDLKERSTALQNEFLRLIDRDAEDFAPLAAAYSLPAATDAERAEKERVMEGCLRTACETPLLIMKNCALAIDVIGSFAKIGSRLALSDAGVGAVFCKAALDGASLNVFINTKAMKDRPYAEKINTEAEDLLAKYKSRADEVFNAVKAELR
jgi:formiminotetrahydrofolate cyclodeaminase